MSSWIREAKYVEDKFLEQLKALNWTTLTIEDNENKNRTKKAGVLKISCQSDKKCEVLSGADERT